MEIILSLLESWGLLDGFYAVIFFLSLLFGACMPILPLFYIKNRWVRTVVTILTEAVALYVSVTYLYGWIVIKGDFWSGIFNRFGSLASFFIGYVLGYLPCRCLADRLDKMVLSERGELGGKKGYEKRD